MGEGEKERGERGFTVVDRRESAEAGESPTEAPRLGTEDAAPGVDFQTFCLSLATSALYHLGVALHPESQQEIPEVNLPLARQSIDSLEMLEEKTRGNLDPDEAKLLESLLYELRMRFVEVGRPAETDAVE